MVLIFSEKNDQTTNKVIQWLLYYNKAFIRINDDEIFEIQVENRRLKLVSRSNCFFIDEITSVWFRRGGLKIKYLEYDNAGLNDYMFETQFWIKDYILYKLEQVKTAFVIPQKSQRSAQQGYRFIRKDRSHRNNVMSGSIAL